MNDLECVDTTVVLCNREGMTLFCLSGEGRIGEGRGLGGLEDAGVELDSFLKF